MKSKLDEIREQYKDNIPPVPYLPVGEVVLVYRLPGDEKTEGGLYKPEEYRDVLSKGILIAAGLAARDVMADALIETGDIVYFARYAGDEKEFSRAAAGKGEKLLQLKVREILGSADGLWRSQHYDIVREVDDDGNTMHIYKRKAA
jgi:co-chaperonin GroES (HSP10)